MKNAIRGTTLAVLGTLAGAGGLAAHPGHIAEGGLLRTVTHALSSPYHVAVIAALVVLAVAWAVAIRPDRAARRAQRAADEPSA